jgi:hypothetical protein
MAGIIGGRCIPEAQVFVQVVSADISCGAAGAGAVELAVPLVRRRQRDFKVDRAFNYARHVAVARRLVGPRDRGRTSDLCVGQFQTARSVQPSARACVVISAVAAKTPTWMKLP